MPPLTYHTGYHDSSHSMYSEDSGLLRQLEPSARRVQLGLGRIVALYRRLSSSYQIY